MVFIEYEIIIIELLKEIVNRDNNMMNILSL